MGIIKQSIFFLLLMAGALFAGQGVWIQVKAVLAQILLQDAWQQTLSDGNPHKPWSWADHWPVARITVPALSIDQIVLSGDSGHVLAFAPGHNKQSHMPGQSGVIVFSGHRDSHFRFLQNLVNGQKIEVETLKGKFIYQVSTQTVVDAEKTVIDVDAGLDQLLLVTCYPFDNLISGGPLRYVVTADMVATNPGYSSNHP